MGSFPPYLSYLKDTIACATRCTTEMTVSKTMNPDQMPEAMSLQCSRWAGRFISAFVVIALLADATIQLFAPAQIASMLQETGFAMDLTRIVVRSYSPAPSFTPSRAAPSSARSS